MINLIALSEGELVKLDDGTNWWPVAARTKHVLEAYPPRHGYAVRYVRKTAAIDMDVNGRAAPAVYITARMRDQNRNVLAEATCLQPIGDYKSYEAGETQVLGRLYTALGYPGNVDSALGKAIDDAELAKGLVLNARKAPAPQIAAKSESAAATTANATAASSPAQSGPLLEVDGSNAASSLVVNDAQGTATVIPPPPPPRSRRVTPVTRERNAPAPTEPAAAISGATAEVDEPCPQVLAEQIAALAMQRGRPPTEVQENIATHALAKAYLPKLREGTLNGKGPHA